MEHSICDLVLLSWNHLEETRPCLESLLEATRVPCRLFIVDNGSEQDVRNVLAAVKPRGAIKEVCVLQNEANEGFPKGMNRGIQASSAPFVCLLNNDLRFTTGWLQEMIAVAESEASIGLVNPSSNNLGNRPPRGMRLEAFAERLRSRRGQYTEAGMCIGFCMLIKRQMLDRVGFLCEQVERIFFEDEDYSMRVIEAGFRCVVAEAAYVHHAEHRTVREGPERQALFARNLAWCQNRWGRRIRIAWLRCDAPAPGSAELRQWLERLVSWTRRRSQVYVYCPSIPSWDKEGLFRSVGLAPHCDVLWHAIPPPFTPWVAMGLILKRRKKRFDLIAASETRWERWMSRLTWLHGATVVSAADEAQLVAQWRRKAWEPSRAAAHVEAMA